MRLTLTDALIILYPVYGILGALLSWQRWVVRHNSAAVL